MAGGSHEARGSVCLRVHMRVHTCTCAFSFNLICVQAPSLERPRCLFILSRGGWALRAAQRRAQGQARGDALGGAGPCLTGVGPNEPFSLLPSGPPSCC